MDGPQFRNLVGFLGRPTTIDRCVDAMGQQATSSSVTSFTIVVTAMQRTHPCALAAHTPKFTLARSNAADV
jgi:hypothetical protein